MPIPFTKAHGAGNDFLVTPADQVPDVDLPSMARAICDRHTGIGADGWILIRGNTIRLFNADGSEPEISGNGTRCAAAFLLQDQLAPEITIETGAGPKHLRLLSVQGRNWMFEMNMGLPSYSEIQTSMPFGEVTLLNVG